MERYGMTGIATYGIAFCHINCLQTSGNITKIKQILMRLYQNSLLKEQVVAAYQKKTVKLIVVGQDWVSSVIPVLNPSAPQHVGTVVTAHQNRTFLTFVQCSLTSVQITRLSSCCALLHVNTVYRNVRK